MQPMKFLGEKFRFLYLNGFNKNIAKTNKI